MKHFLVLICLFSPFAAAWGPEGHRITSMIGTATFFNDFVRNNVSHILGGMSWWEKSAEFPEGLINYADTYARISPGRWSYSLHFAFTNREPNFDYSRDCSAKCGYWLAKQGYCASEDELLSDCCVVAAVEKYKQEMWLYYVGGQWQPWSAVNNTADHQLRFLLLNHFVGDMHQPLHVDLMPDLGGNEFRIKFFNQSICQPYPQYPPEHCELHMAWDSLMIQKRLLDFGPAPPANTTETDPRELLWAKHIMANNRNLYLDLGYNYDVTNWASESVALAALAYTQHENFTLDQRYYDAAIKIVEMQLYKAGRRIAQLSDFFFSGYDRGECKVGFYPFGDCKWRKPMCRPTGKLAPPSPPKRTDRAPFFLPP